MRRAEASARGRSLGSSTTTATAAGTSIDPANGRDDVLDIRVVDGQIAAIDFHVSRGTRISGSITDVTNEQETDVVATETACTLATRSREDRGPRRDGGRRDGKGRDTDRPITPEQWVAFVDRLLRSPEVSVHELLHPKHGLLSRQRYTSTKRERNPSNW